MNFEKSEFINHSQVKYCLERRSFRKYKVIGTIEVVNLIQLPGVHFIQQITIKIHIH